MVCLRNISVDTLHKGDTEDNSNRLALQIWITWCYGECYLRITSYTAAQPGHGVDHPSPSCTEVKEGVEVYVYPHLPGTSWPVIGWTLPFTAAQSSNWPAVQKVNKQGFWRRKARKGGRSDGKWRYRGAVMFTLSTLMWTCYSRSFPHYMVPESLLPHSQQPPTYPCPEPDKSSHTLSSCSFKTHWNMIPFPSVFRSSILLGFLQKSPTHISSLYACHMPRPSSLPHVWWIAQMTKLSIMYSSPFSYYMLHFRPRYFPQHPILENPQPLFFP